MRSSESNVDILDEKLNCMFMQNINARQPNVNADRGRDGVL